MKLTADEITGKTAIPTERVDVVIDTDTYNELDDLFAVGYLLRSSDKLNTVAMYAASFSFPEKYDTGVGMELSYREILKLLALAGEDKPVYRGATCYLESESEPVISEASLDLAKRADSYSPEHPLYVIAIGAPTNIASAILLNPRVKENTVLVWLGGHAHETGRADEFNMRQDLAATRIILSGEIPLVQVPCLGVAEKLTISAGELREHLLGKNRLADYLAERTLPTPENPNDPHPWRILWDVCAIGWLLNDGERFMQSRIARIKLPTDSLTYTDAPADSLCNYVLNINREPLIADMLAKLGR